MRQIATGRIVGLLIAVIGVCISIWCARGAVLMNAEFNQWLDARPMETAIDLSKPGETTVPFHQTCSISHGEALYLTWEPNDATERRSRAFWLWKIFRRGRLFVDVRRLKQPHLHRNYMI